MTSGAPTSLPDVLAAVTLGPEDRVVLIYPPHMTAKEFDVIREQIRACGGERQIFAAMGFEDVIVLRATKAEGSTVGQCGHLIIPAVIGLDGFVERVQSCHLAYGHTGMHSDGESTWSNDPPIRLQPESSPMVCGDRFFHPMFGNLAPQWVTCELPPNHGGRHRDGEATWSNEGSGS